MGRKLCILILITLLSVSCSPPRELTKTAQMLQCNFYNEQEFIKWDVGEESLPKESTSSIRGGIVPHHLIAGEMISTFFKILSREDPDIVIIIGPNHKGLGLREIHTGSWSWQTPFGILDGERDFVNSLVNSHTADADFNLLEEDHSISGLIPYIKYYLPSCEVVPILLHGTLGFHRAKELGKNLMAKIEGENMKGLIIASVDFSHYLTLEDALKMDEVSIDAIGKRDYTTIMNFNNDYMDSPPSIIALLSAMDTGGANEMEILDHGNSDLIMGSRSLETTSYFTIIFRESP